MRLSPPSLRSSLSALAVLAAPIFAFAQDARLTLEQTLGRGERVRFTPDMEAWSWAADGVHLVRGRGDEREWVDARTGESAEEPAGDTGEADAQANPGRRRRGARGNRELEGLAPAAFLESHGAQVELAERAPEGDLGAFVMENDLYLARAGAEPLRLTEGGGHDRFHGKLDWVYQEEIYGRGNFKGFWWSPDARHVALLGLDESAVDTFTVVDHVEQDTFRVKAEPTRYPKAGDPNPTVQLGWVDVTAASPEVRWLDLSRYEDTEPLVVRVDFTPDGAHLLFVVQDRIQTWAELVAFDLASGEQEVWIREESPTWTPRPSPPRWLEDGSFLWLSDRGGYRHAYRYRPGGELVCAVTQGDWSLRRITEIDEEAGRMWFTATEGGAVNDHLYRVELDGTGFRRLTHGPGHHAVSFNADRSLFLDRVSSLAEPGVQRLCDADGVVLREVARASVPAAEQYATSPWELLEIEARDGYVLDAALLKPVGFDADRAYPVWLPTYSGPNAPSVRNRWNSSVWYQFLAQQGYVVLQVNVRSASGRGMASTGACYKQLGVQELRDLEDAVRWLTSHPWADAERVGITGGSYGGFMAAYALTHSRDFALGIASSGVYDWGMYDTVYTERYMSTPQANPDGYRDTSVIESAGDLHGHLLITHGVMDDNVHFQNALQLAWALQKAGKSFEFMPYPQARHGIRDADQRAFARELEWRTIQEHLGAPAGDPGP